MWEWEARIKGFLSISLFCLQLVIPFVSQNWKAWSKARNCSNSVPVKQNLDSVQSGERVSKEDVIVMMERLGMNVEWGGDGIEEFGVQEIGQLLEEDATFTEVGEAFDVFDQNKDGFIDSRELQRVLSCLGLEKDLTECQKMINAADQNGDGLIDRNEFVRILEQSFG